MPYKNGATRILSYFIGIENQLTFSNKTIEQIDFLDVAVINQVKGAHEKSGEFSAEKFRLQATKKNLSKSDISLFIIRDPYKRFSSF